MGVVSLPRLVASHLPLMLQGTFDDTRAAPQIFPSIILVVLGLMLGLSHLQKQGTISEQTFQMAAIAIAVVVVVINGILRRKVKP